MQALNDDRGGACVTKKSTNIVDVKSTVLLDLPATCNHRLEMMRGDASESLHLCIILGSKQAVMSTRCLCLLCSCAGPNILCLTLAALIYPAAQFALHCLLHICSYQFRNSSEQLIALHTALCCWVTGCNRWGSTPILSLSLKKYCFACYADQH